MAWPTSWDRGNVLGAIEEASGVSLSADDSLPDTLIAKAQELGLKPIDLKLWIYDHPEHGWTPEAMESWARRMHMTAPLAACGHCGKKLYTQPEIEHHRPPEACHENGKREQKAEGEQQQ
jgi:hypothetical protein